MKKMLNTRKRTWSAGLIMLFFLISRFAYSQIPEINQARYQVQIDQPTKAEGTLKQAIAAHPEDASIWYHLGEVQIKKGDVKGAEISFQKGIELNAKEALNYVGKGHLRLSENKAAEAKILFDQALAISKSKNTSVLKAVAEAYLTQAAYATNALTLLQKAKSSNNNDAETYILLGDAYLLQNNGGLAVTNYEQAATLNTKDATAEYKIGLVYLRSKNTEAADVALTKAVTIDPSYTLAYKELGELYYLEKKADKAVTAYEQYLKLTEKPEQGKVRFAFFLFMAKDFKRANEVFKELVQRPDVSPLTIRFYGISLLEVEDLQQSRTVFEQYFTKADTSIIEASDYNYYGRLLLKLTEDSLAVESFRKSTALVPNQPDIIQLTGEILFKAKRYHEAIDAYKQLILIRTRPASQDFFTIGRSYYITKQYEKADTAFQKLAELQPTLILGPLWLARTKANLDPESETGLAKPFYEVVIEKATANPEKEKANLIEAYSYLGYYLYLKGDLKASKSWWEKVITVDPTNVKANEAIKALNEAAKPKKP